MVDLTGAGFSAAAVREPGLMFDASITVSSLTPAWTERYAAFAADRPHGTAQKPAWLAAWSRQASPAIAAVTVLHGDAVWMMLPLEIVRRGPFRVARFVGGTHANANFPASSCGAAPHHLRRALARAIRQARPDIDLIHLERMAPEMEGAANPLAALGGVPSPDPALSLSLAGGFDAVLGRADGRGKAKRHRSHARRFAEAGGLRLIEARSEKEVDRLLDNFFRFKQARFSRSGIADVFADLGVQAAFRTLFREALAKADPSFVLHGLEVGGVVRAVTGHSRAGAAMTCEFGAISEDELSRHSPGEFLFHEIIREACERNRAVYDFGVGDEPYKRRWCGQEVWHLDVSLPLSVKGRLLNLALGCAARAESALKSRPTVWSLVKRLRRTAAGRSASGEYAASHDRPSA